MGWANFAVVPVPRLRQIPLPEGLGLSAPEGFALERYEAVITLDPGREGDQAVEGLADAAGADRTVAVTLQVQLLVPADRRVSTLLVEVVNRGQAAHIPFDGYAVTADQTRVTGPVPPPVDGTSLALRDGGAVLWCGWQWDLAGADRRLLAATVPEVRAAVHRTHPPVTVALTAAEAADQLPLFGLPDAASPYPVGDLDDAEAELRTSDGDGGEDELLPRAEWGFQRDSGEGGGVRVWSARGFAPGTAYQLSYRSGRCPVAGAAVLALRDLVAFLRSGGQGVGSPLAAPPATVLGYGMSQAGRFLRQFLHDNRNVDADGGRVFDGLLVHAAGGLRDGLAELHAQPSKAPDRGRLPPGPIASGALLDRMAPAARPWVLFTHTATEYWRGDAALTHLDPATGRDLPDPDRARHYLLAGLDHYGARRPPGPDVNYPVNDVDAGLLLRAVYWALRRWAGEGVEPPPSAVPRFTDQTAVRRRLVLARFHAAVGREAVPALDSAPTIDAAPAPDAVLALDDGWPPVIVAAVDAHGNEIPGLRLPEVAVPLATLTGWNPQPARGGRVALAPLAGARLPLAGAVPDRSPDPTLAAMAERRCRAIAEGLVARGALLAEDVDECVRRALRHRARAAAGEPGGSRATAAAPASPNREFH